MVTALLLLELQFAMAVRLGQTKVHLLVLVLIVYDDFVTLSLVVVLIILKLSEGVDRVLGEDLLSRLIQALEEKIHLNGGDHVVLFFRDEITSF